jgi:ribosomal protein L31E
LVETEKAKIYYLIDRLLRLILTLPVSTATTERSFSAMKIIKNKLRNKMKAGFLADSMSVYIEREIAATISSDTIIDEFKALATRNASF